MDITLDHISKRYAYKTVLNGVTVTFAAGKVHALLGENGAGKSTAAAIMCGALAPDKGTLVLDGKPVLFKNERDALQAGIACVRQRPLLAESLTVRENIMLGSAVPFSKKKADKLIVPLRDRIARELNLDALIAHTGGDGRFYTALIAALTRNPGVLILDEPSALLDWEQRRMLYACIRQTAQSGTNVIVITHNMQEAQLYTDTVTVLKNGNIAAHYDHSTAFTAASTSTDASIKPAPAAATGHSLVLSFSGINVRPLKRPALFDVSFSAADGGITLISGLSESGLGTLENVITGMETTRCTGSFILTQPTGTRSVDLSSGKFTADFLRRRSGLFTAIVPSDRTYRGSDPGLTVMQMLTALYRGKKPEAYADMLIARAGITIGRDEFVSNLSGGMLQRLILARELAGDHRFILFCEPLQGLDKEAAAETCRIISERAHAGAAVVILSSTEYPAEDCSAVYKLTGGKITGGAA